MNTRIASERGSPESPRTLEDFAADLRAQGFDQVLERRWPPDIQLDLHTHPFAAKAVVVHGEMWLTVAGVTLHLNVGDTFELEANEPHAERYGREGATYWVGRRQPST